MDHFTHLIGALMISFFILLNVFAMYFYLRRRTSLDPRSPINHAIHERFDSEDELQAYHQQRDELVKRLGEQALDHYRSVFGRIRAGMDPAKAKAYPLPSKRFDEL